MSIQTKYKINASYNFIRIFKNLESKKPPSKYPTEQPDAIKVANFISEYINNGWNVNLKGKMSPLTMCRMIQRIGMKK